MEPWGVQGLPMLTKAQVADVITAIVRRHEQEAPAARLARRGALERGVGCVYLMLQKDGGGALDPYAAFAPDQ